jgi:PAS domain S-box-containing protein
MARKRHTDTTQMRTASPVLPDRARADNLTDAGEQLLTEVEELRRQVVELHELKDEDERAIRDWEWLARLAEENPDPVLRVSQYGVVLYRNPASVPLCRQWNPEDELTIPPAVRKLVSAAYAGTEVMHGEMAFGQRTYLVTVAPVPPPAKYVNIYARDITDRKQVEEILQETRDYLDSLFGYANTPIVVWDRAFKITRFNHAFERLTGLEAQDVLGREIAILFPSDRREESLAYIHRTSEGQRWDVVEIPILCIDGTVRLVIWNSANVLDADGKTVVATIAQGQDITERKRAEEALRDLNATLESKVAERTEVLEHRTRQLQKLTLELAQTEDRERKRMAEILHDDLQQILAAAKFHLSVMRSRVKHDASVGAVGVQIDEMLNEAIEKSRGLAHDLSPAVLHHSDFTETLRWLAGQIEAKHGLAVHVRARGTVDLPSETLANLLYRTAQELLFNVVKHARAKEADITLRQHGHCIGLSVSDQGRGFDPQQLRAMTGYGLLSIRERIELLGGRVKIRSAPGEGSTVLVIVPNSLTAGTTPEVRTRPGGQPTEAGRWLHKENGRLRVLLADDHRIVREGLRLLLCDQPDVEVVGEAAHGREAVDLALRLEPDVVIMDFALPLIDGDVATRQIKEHLPRTRVIALSTYNEPQKMERMFRAGAEGYVLKTASSEELLAAIRGNNQAGSDSLHESTL